MNQTVSTFRSAGGDAGLDLSRRGDGQFVLRTWRMAPSGVLKAAAPVYLSEGQLMRLFDDIGRTLILTLEQELEQIMEGL
jgi:hypothetical protein